MKTNKLELVAGGVAIAALTGAAAILYKINHRVYHRKFDVSTVSEIKGKVEDIIYSGLENGDGRGHELILKSNDEYIPVHLGPAWFVDKQGKNIKKGDKISVTGSKVKHNHKEVIIAQSIKKSDKILHLRNDNGHPVWRAWANHNT